MGGALGKEKGQFSANDINGMNRALFDLFDSYDQKDWDRLRKNCTSTLMIDYRGIGKQKWDNMSATDYVSMVTDTNFLGDPLTLTQHLIGVSWYERVSATEAIGHHQIRAAHIVYTGPDFKDIRVKGHAHATNEHRYKKVNGTWKFAGIKPLVHSSEYDFPAVWDRAPKEDGKAGSKGDGEVGGKVGGVNGGLNGKIDGVNGKVDEATMDKTN